MILKNTASASRMFVLVLFAGLLALAGCSDDGDAEPTAEPTPEEAAGSSDSGDSESEIRGTALGQPQDAPDFELTDHNGDSFRLSDHEGKVTAIFFGYTHCPDICPLTLSHMDAASEELGDQAEDAMFLFISVDPERDTPDQLASYVERVDAEIIGLTGDQEEMEEVWESYDITVQIEEREDDDYLVSHSSQIWLINAQGQAELILPPSADGADMAHDMQWLLDRAS